MHKYNFFLFEIMVLLILDHKSYFGVLQHGHSH
uniref:Uncharacterized protein n=1 Tax=Setaria viridis TaxID=4556 RepID=A0A4U6U9Q0_SETVI|nr:hypothetical protein SEVIR_5G043933v2 [Setaria viridis]